MNSKKLNTTAILLSNITFCIFAILTSRIVAHDVPMLPGTEITEKSYLENKYSANKIKALVPLNSPSSATWLDTAAKTWDSPSLPMQMAEDPEPLKLGMGAVFVPRMTTKGLEPDVEFLDANGNVAKRGPSGKKYSLLPGKYYMMFGSGSQDQQMVKEITIIEGKTIPVIPDWSGLTVEIVDENNIPIRGEYELARIDKFEPYGRRRGANPDLGEETKPWILRPGIYKIFQVGDSYNTLTHFVTVRLLPGEFTHCLLVMDNTENQAIIGGGVIIPGEEHRFLNNWKYTFDLGGSLDLKSVNDKLDNSNNISGISISMLSRIRLNYNVELFDWDTRIKVDEGVNIFWEKKKFSKINSEPDDILVQSLFTLKLADKIGPYGRVELNTSLIPNYEQKPATVDKHYFVIVKSDSTISSIDTTTDSYLLQPTLSPIAIEAGLGVNTNILDRRYFELKLLTGFGFSQESRFNESEVIDTPKQSNDYSTYTKPDIIYQNIKFNNKSHSVIRKIGTTTTRPEFGPEMSLFSVLRLGKIASVESELKLFAPVQRYKNEDFRPDIDWRAIVSWRIFRTITLDYQYEYSLNWPDETELRQNNSKHRLLARFSYSSR